MLVLTRKSGEAVVIGGTDGLGHLIKATVLEISRGRVRLGIEAPAEILVHRWEVWERIHNSGQPDIRIVQPENCQAAMPPRHHQPTAIAVP